MIREWMFRNQFLRVGNLYRFVSVKMREFTLRPSERCLILAPHPDDESIGCGGLLLRYPAQCDVICLTDGRLSDPEREAAEVIRKRRCEFEKAMGRVGIGSYHYLGAPDRQLIASYGLFKSIDVSGYDFIFLPNHLDQQKDHQAVTVLLKRLISNRLHRPNLRLLFYEVWAALPLPNAFLDISDRIEEKRALINIYQSQVKFVDYAERSSALNRHRGLAVYREYAEMYTEVDPALFLKI